MKKEMLSTLYGIAVIVLALSEAVLILVSWLLSATMTEGIRSLLSSEGIRWLLGRFADSQATPLLVWLLLLSMAVGCFSRSGLASYVAHWPSPSTYRQRISFRFTIFLLVVYVGVGLALTVTPHAILLSATGQLFPSSPFSRALVPAIAFGLSLLSVCFGVMTGAFKSLADVLHSLTAGIAKAAPLFLLYILFVLFYESLRFVFW